MNTGDCMIGCIVGLVMSGIAFGSKTHSTPNGFLFIGIGLITISFVFGMLPYLNKGKE